MDAIKIILGIFMFSDQLKWKENILSPLPVFTALVVFLLSFMSSFLPSILPCYLNQLIWDLLQWSMRVFLILSAGILFHQSIPFRGELADGLCVGRTIIVKGETNHNANRYATPQYTCLPVLQFNISSFILKVAVTSLSETFEYFCSFASFSVFQFLG